jgi:hypothetical protein
MASGKPVLEKKKKKKQTVRREIQYTQELYSTGINDNAYNEEACSCSSAAVQRSIPAVGGLIVAVANPAVDIGALDVL